MNKHFVAGGSIRTMRSKQIATTILALAALGMLACGGAPNKAGEKGANISKYKAAIWDSPSQDAKAVTTINAGEKVKVIGTKEVTIGGSKVNFSEVRTTDGKEGWIRASSLALQVYTVVGDVQLYKRNNTASGVGHGAEHVKRGVQVFVEETQKENKWMQVSGRGAGYFTGWVDGDSGLEKGIVEIAPEAKTDMPAEETKTEMPSKEEPSKGE